MEESILDMLYNGTCPIILVLGRKPYKVMPDKLQKLIESNRLLFVSISDQSRISRESALLCNEYICNQSDDLTFGSRTRRCRSMCMDSKRNFIILNLNRTIMKIETKGIFEALPNCLSLQEIIEYLDSRNYDERKAKGEYHEMYEEGSIILNNKFK
ncbi:hypothetical protein L6471_09210 [Segatella bryantii]|uniref:hypothetical protein n=1 Tax=Segatella bryantii TaxID=77095 RepID=UPI001EDA8D6C|nr:hypothetical protein [Segatella bryantii]UKK75369.1 hypothetical protein L6471_09210 [Segatella bryantii]